jgi:hypothetical protein
VRSRAQDACEVAVRWLGVLNGWLRVDGIGRCRHTYDVPVRLDTLTWRIDAPEEYRKCSHPEHGKASKALPADQLWVIKTHTERFSLGQIRVYCRDHLASAGDWRGGRSASDRGAGRPTGAVCPNCNVAVPLTGICDTCEWSAK